DRVALRVATIAPRLAPPLLTQLPRHTLPVDPVAGNELVARRQTRLPVVNKVPLARNRVAPFLEDHGCGVARPEPVAKAAARVQPRPVYVAAALRRAPPSPPQRR